MSKNTLFNYFSRSPVVTKKEANTSSPTNIDSPSSTTITPQHKTKSTTATPRNKKTNKSSSCTTTPQSKRNLISIDSSKINGKRKVEKENIKNIDGDSPINESTPLKKRRRIMELESEEEDSGDEYEPGNETLSDEDMSSVEQSSEEDSFIVSDSDDASPKKITKKPKLTNNRSLLNVSSGPDKMKNSLSSSKENNADHWPHLKLEFLKPDKIRDGCRRLASDPNYNPKTLYVPDDFKQKLTPAVRQWWEMKSQNFDIVLFFKVGKFYELYHMDAVIAANELNLTFMKGDFAHVGFPEIAYGRFSSTLVEKGYKVARVEQTETPDMMSERCRNMSKPTKFDKVVKREICQITSRGTRIFGVLDGESKDAESRFLLAISEKEIDNASSSYGVCFIDTSIGIFHIGQFIDDRHTSRLRTLVAHFPPVQVLYEKYTISARTQQLLNTILSGVQKEQLHPDSEFLPSSKTLITLAEGNYFENNSFPEQLNEFLKEDASVNMIVSDDCELGVKALGAVIWYLKRCLLDHQLLSMARFSIYKPIDLAVVKDVCEKNAQQNSNFARHMVLDAITLKNLNVLENSSGGLEGTLLQKLDNCCTPFGKRLMHEWICNPLGNVCHIKKRQEAVTFLKNCHFVREARTTLSQLPDLERLMSKIYSQGNNGLEPSHPDTRAILFEEKTYSKRKITDFISALNGFKLAQKIIKMFQECDEISSDLVVQCCYHPDQDPKGLFPDLTQHLNFFHNAFNHTEAQKEGRILPSEGTDTEYDEAIDDLKSIEKELSVYLKLQCEHFGCKVTYYGTDKKRFQIEVPDHASKRAGSGYELQSQRKGFRRYTTTKTKALLEKMKAAEEQKTNVLKNLRQRIFSRFSEKFSDWNSAIQCLAVLDVLLSFAEYCNGEENVTCIPELVSPLEVKQPFVTLIDGRYPCVTGDEVFIPNNTVIGSETDESQPSLMLVTGPNMGGKSTLMRQLGLITIMAHMGCYVPARELKLSIVDRIFTRLGANDDIMAGESTFYVELCETGSILQHATKHSLVLIDELGRGTSTYDGTAIASAVLNELCRMQCPTLFSTHYHSLVEDFKNNSQVTLGHMSCMVENENDDGNSNSEETVIFLYKFAEGACPKSYGFNAARLAGMPQHITKLGRQRAKQFEVDVNRYNRFKTLFQTDIDDIRQMIQGLRM